MIKFFILTIIIFLAFIFSDSTVYYGFGDYFVILFSSSLISGLIFGFIYIHKESVVSNKIKNLDNQDYIYLGDRYYKNKNYVFHNGKVTKIDSNSFKYLGNEYATDGKNIYFEGHALDKNIDVYSFKYLGGAYIKDNNNIYCNGKKINDVNLHSFTFIEVANGTMNFAKDNNGFYMNDQRIIADTFEYIGSGYMKKDGVLNYCDSNSSENNLIDTQNITSLGDDYALGDNNVIYLYGEIFEELESNDTYENLGNGLFRVNKDIYLGLQKLTISTDNLIIHTQKYIGTNNKLCFIDYGELYGPVEYDKDSFEVLGENVARDKNNYYFNGTKIEYKNDIKYYGGDFFSIDGKKVPYMSDWKK